MAIYHIDEHDSAVPLEVLKEWHEEEEVKEEKKELFSTLATRFLFFLLLVADIGWFFYSAVSLCVKGFISCLTLFRWGRIRGSLKKSWLSLKRSLACGMALLVALFSPSLGIMFSYLYFTMHDKEGMDEVVPSSLKDQFEGLFPS